MRAHRAATRPEIASWVLAGAALVLVLAVHLLPALIGGLVVYLLVHRITETVIEQRIASLRARLVAVALLSTAIVALLSVSIVALVAFLRSDAGSLPALMTKLAQVIDGSRSLLPDWVVAELPPDAESLRGATVHWLRVHAADVGSMGRGVGRVVAYVAIGMVIGAMVALHEVRPDSELPALAAAMLDRVMRLADAFRRIVFAQVRIATINAALTALYLAVALPLSGTTLPYTKTLIVVTFVCGLLPVVGNLISNTVIVLVSLSQSPALALVSLAFLVVVHKLEYFLNARIVGTQIRSRAWELLIAMLAMEAAFGAAGVIAAPIYYAYVKDELAARGLV